MKLPSTLALAGVLALAGCDRPSPPAAAPAGAAPVSGEVLARRRIDPDQVARGAKLYAANCAVCHGMQAQGAPNWHQPGPDGKYPPPPLDGSAHAWHHPSSVLKQTIKEGTARLGGAMPPWKDKLSDAEIDAIIAWMISRWPDEVYAAWREIDAKAGRR